MSHKRDRYRISCLLLLIPPAILVSLAGCVGGQDDVIVLPPIDSTDNPYEIKILEAWAKFESRLYSDSIPIFNEALDIDPLRSDAYLGLGWSYAMVDQLDESASSLELAVVRDPGSPDGYASIAFVYLAQSDYQAAIAAADRAISLGGEEYMFHHVPEVRVRNLRLLIAESYYATGQYADAHAQIDVLEPDNELDQNSSTYIKDLLLKIEELGSNELALTELNI